MLEVPKPKFLDNGNFIVYYTLETFIDGDQMAEQIVRRDSLSLRFEETHRPGKPRTRRYWISGNAVDQCTYEGVRRMLAEGIAP